MIFSELRFFLFFALVFAVYWALRTNRARKVWLIAVSLFFYAAWDWRFLSLILYQTGVDFLAALRIEASDDPRRRRRWLRVSLVSNLGLLGVFKYLGFFADSFASLLRAAGLEAGHVTLHIVLPVGISFYTFQSLSYTIDVYRRRIPAVRSPLDFGTFVTFFPQLVAGPIVRAVDFLDQLPAAKELRRVDFRWCLTLFLIGFFKKACVSDNISPFVDAFYRSPATFTTPSAWLAAILYATQIYCDFSGYTDMAIASAGLLGYRLRDNFDAPYLSLDITDFWRRWHMSLSSWLKDYLYVSLGGNRGGTLFTYRNLMLTMLLGGLWHGASWNFVLWGFMHGMALIVHRVWRAAGLRLDGHPLQRGLAWAINATWVLAAWVPFRAATFGDTLTTLRALVGAGAAQGAHLTSLGAYADRLWLLAAALFAGHLAVHRGYFREAWRNVTPTAYALLYGLAWSVVIALKSTNYQPFIYFQF
jgi:alginate O-acetyltransferase complex protein AlgI